MTENVKILLVDDHAVVRDGLAALLSFQDNMTVVGHAGDGEEGVAKFRELAPDVVLMDLRMPRMGGVDAIRAIRNCDADARVIVLTTYDGDEDVYRALEAGAVGYLLKDSATDDLLTAVRTAVSGGNHIPAEIAQRLVERTQSGPGLTARETEVLELIAQGRSNKEIGQALFIAEGTVKTHVNKILDKLDAPDRTGAVTIALRRGLIELPR